MSSNTLRKRAFGRRSLSQRYGRRRAFLASPVDSYSLLNESRVVASKPDGVDAFEEYKLFVEDTARFTDRRQTVTNICVTINSVLLSAVALLVKDAGLQRWVIVPATITIFVAGIAICFVWWQLICKYKRLVKLRINKLRAMENLPEMAGCQRMYHAEDEIYKHDANDQLIEGFASSFSDLERFLPFVFMFLYLAFGIAIVVARCQGLI